jgi:hypothetical protein
MFLFFGQALHSVWTLPSGDDDFSNRWKAIKIRFVQALPQTERRSKVLMAKGERLALPQMPSRSAAGPVGVVADQAHRWMTHERLR